MQCESQKDDVKKMKTQIKNLELELNKLVEVFKRETGIPVLLEVSGFESKHIGQEPKQTISVSGFIFERL